MTATHIDHLNLTVRDLDESIDWYRRVFGFELVEREVQDGQPWGVLRSEGGTGSAMLCIYQAPGREMLDRFALRDRKMHGLSHFALRIHNRSEWEATLAREQIKLNDVVEWPHSSAWYINDPTGYEIEVVLWRDEKIAFEPLASDAAHTSEAGAAG